MFGEMGISGMEAEGKSHERLPSSEKTPGCCCAFAWSIKLPTPFRRRRAAPASSWLLTEATPLALDAQFVGGARAEDELPTAAAVLALALLLVLPMLRLLLMLMVLLLLLLLLLAAVAAVAAALLSRAAPWQGTTSRGSEEVGGARLLLLPQRCLPSKANLNCQAWTAAVNSMRTVSSRGRRRRAETTQIPKPAEAKMSNKVCVVKDTGTLCIKTDRTRDQVAGMGARVSMQVAAKLMVVEADATLTAGLAPCSESRCASRSECPEEYSVVVSSSEQTDASAQASPVLRRVHSCFGSNASSSLLQSSTLTSGKLDSVQVASGMVSWSQASAVFMRFQSSAPNSSKSTSSSSSTSTSFSETWGSCPEHSLRAKMEAGSEAKRRRSSSSCDLVLSKGISTKVFLICTG
mmetsp:Transcript_32625/g.69970  ORF Transcript_32625/g.69970 Transcript_32625/m.69970 type:complete len:406 (+) Transcript_32625:632-1849(+)